MKRHGVINTAVTAVRRTMSGVLRHVIEGAYEARCRDIERVIGRSDGHLTDEVERRIAQYLMRNSSF